MIDRKGVIKRVTMAGFKFDPKWKCLVCGHQFRVCEHTAQDNEEVIEKVRNGNC